MTAVRRQTQKYTEDFNREAVALVTEQGYSVAEAARSWIQGKTRSGAGDNKTNKGRLRDG